MALRKGFQMGGENVVVDVGSEVEDNENTEVVRGQNLMMLVSVLCCDWNPDIQMVQTSHWIKNTGGASHPY